jgi:Mce-associated membrane protein
MNHRTLFQEMFMTVTTAKNSADPAEDETEVVDESVGDAVQPASTSDASDVDTASQPGEGADVADEDARPLRSWPRRVLVGTVTVLFVAALGVSGILGWMLWQQRELTHAGQRAQASAVAYATVLTSIDSNKVDENFNQVLDGATGEFKDLYSQSSTQLRQLLVDNKASAHGVVVDSAIQSESKNKVVVLLFVDQSVSNTNVPDPRIDRSRIKMTMEFVDGRWRASQVALP